MEEGRGVERVREKRTLGEGRWGWDRKVVRKGAAEEVEKNLSVEGVGDDGRGRVG